MGVLKDFKSFLIRGNVIDLAVAVIIGGAFGKIVASFVKDVIMPPIGILLGDVDFKELKFILKEAVVSGEKIVHDAVSINYGNFIQTVVEFVIVGFCIFIVIKFIESRKKKEEEAKPNPGPSTNDLLSEIRDLLKK